MSDALNLVALAKMAVIVIGIFLVPIITRKFAADLGAPVGQMAMNRAAIAGAGLGFVGAKVAWAATQSARSSAAASILAPLGSKVRQAGLSLQKQTETIHDVASSTKSQTLTQKAGAKLERFGQYLEEASVRHEAKKVGIEPPSVGDKIKKTLSADPQVIGPIRAKEQRYQAFVQSRSQNLSPSALAGNPVSYSNNASPSLQSPASAPLQNSRFSVNAACDFARPSASRVATSPVDTHRLNSNSGATDRLASSSSERTNLSARVRDVRHRWRDSKRLSRLFQSSDERKPS